MSEQSKHSRLPDNAHGTESAPSDHIGDIIKRTRMARGLSIETLARELKITSRYLEALEANDYDRMPGDTYIRVYLRSICVYFSLNPDEILLRFFDQRGLTGVDTLRKDSSTKINLTAIPEQKKPGMLPFLGIAVIVALAASAFFAGRQGWFGHPPAGNAVKDSAGQAYEGDTTDFVPELNDLVEPNESAGDLAPTVVPVEKKVTAPPRVADTAKKMKPAAASLKDTVVAVKKTADTAVKPSDNRKIEKDSLPNSTPVPKAAEDTIPKTTVPAGKPVQGDSGKRAATVTKPADSQLDPSNQKPAIEKQKKDSIKTVQSPPSIGKSMKLRITVVNDSCWARVFSDGNEWRKILRKGTTMSWSAKDSFNVLVGANRSVIITLDEKPVTIPGPGVVTFKIDQLGNVIPWTNTN
jgi:cytoskeleton protein RodZ